jgi:hypothetical protein
VPTEPYEDPIKSTQVFFFLMQSKICIARDSLGELPGGGGS